jgi:hypothetical protein
MTHLLLFNEQLACGAEIGPWSHFIQLVDCPDCHRWHDANQFAKSLVPLAQLDYEEEADAFDEANEDMNARLYAEHRDRNDN